MRPRLLLLAVLACPGLAPGADSPGEARRAELRHLVRHDCGSCHGIRLTGGLGPPLTVDALAGRSDAALEAAVLHGRPGTAMPPWEGLLTTEEARWIVRALKSGRVEAQQ